MLVLGLAPLAPTARTDRRSNLELTPDYFTHSHSLLPIKLPSPIHRAFLFFHATFTYITDSCSLTLCSSETRYTLVHCLISSQLLPLTMPSATGENWEKYKKNFADDEEPEKKITPLTES